MPVHSTTRRDEGRYLINHTKTSLSSNTLVSSKEKLTIIRKVVHKMASREYKTISALRNGETIEFEGLSLKAAVDQTLNEGDLYIAERNSVKFLTVKTVDHNIGAVFPTTLDYAFNIGECVKVEEA